MFDANSRKLSKIRTSAATSCSRFLWHRPSFSVVCVAPQSSRRPTVPYKLTVTLSLLSLLTGCGVVGDILPPTLNLPARATDMTVLEHGDKLDIAFKLSTTTTEGMLIRHPAEMDLRIGPAPADPNDTK